MSAPGPCRCAFAVAAFPKPSDSTIWHTMARRRHECRRGTQSACATYNSNCAFRDLPRRVRQHSLPHLGLHRPSGLHALALAGAQLHVRLYLLLRPHHAHLRRAETGRLEPLGPLHHLQEQRALPAARIAAAPPDHLLLAAGGPLPAGRGDRMHDAAPAALAGWWEQLLGGNLKLHNDSEAQLDAPGLTLYFVAVPEPKATKDRLHI